MWEKRLLQWEQLITCQSAAGADLLRRLLCEYSAEQNVELKPLLNADKGRRSWSPETSFEVFVTSFMHQRDLQCKNLDKLLQNEVFLATGRNLLVLTKTSIQMGLNFRHRQLLERTAERYLSCISWLLGKGWDLPFSLGSFPFSPALLELFLRSST